MENNFSVVAGGKWMCRLCCAMLGSKTGAKRHLVSVHLKEKNYACCYCGKSFSVSSNARAHEKKCAERPT